MDKVDFMTQEQADALLAAVQAAAGFEGNPDRIKLIEDMRENHAAAVKAKKISAETPVAAAFTEDELRERNLWNDGGEPTGKVTRAGNSRMTRRGARLKAGRNGKGDIALVKTLEDGRTLIILRNPE